MGDEDMEGVVKRGGGRAVRSVQGSLATDGWAQRRSGECHDVTPAAAAEDDGGPSALHFMRNHLPAKESLPTRSTILWKREEKMLEMLCLLNGWKGGHIYDFYYVQRRQL